MEGGVAPGARGLHPPSRREPVEDMPGRVYPHDIAMVKFRSDQRVGLAIKFVTGKGLHPWTRLAPVQDQLLVLDLDIYLQRADFRPGHVGIRETFIQVRTAWVIL